jgi:hypothetical protein
MESDTMSIHKNSEKTEIEVYKMWFEFLRLSDRKNWAPHVEEKFGDVWATDFPTWWQDHSYLFERLDPFDIEVIKDTEGYKWFADDEDENILIIAVHLLEPKINLEEAFANILSKHHKAPKGRPKFEDLTWHYNLQERPSIASLAAVMEVYTVHLANPSMQPWEVEEEVQLIAKTGDNARTLWKGHPSPKNLVDRKKAQTDEVNRHLLRARNLIRNVEQGLFPKDD